MVPRRRPSPGNWPHHNQPARVCVFPLFLFQIVFPDPTGYRRNFHQETEQASYDPGQMVKLFRVHNFKYPF